MTGDTSKRDDLQRLWREQLGGPMNPSISVIKDRALTLERGIERQNVLEWIACGAVIAIFGWYCIDAPNVVVRLGALWVMGSAVFVAWHLHAHGRMRRPSDVGLGTAAYLAEHRQNLLEHAKFLRGASLWYVTPITTGVLLFVTGKYLGDLDELSALLRFLASVAIVLTVAVVVSILNFRAARKLTDEADRCMDEDL